MYTLYHPGTKIIKSWHNDFTAHQRRALEPVVEIRHCKVCASDKPATEFYNKDKTCSGCRGFQVKERRAAHMGAYSRAVA